MERNEKIISFLILYFFMKILSPCISETSTFVAGGYLPKYTQPTLKFPDGFLWI